MTVAVFCAPTFRSQSAPHSATRKSRYRYAISKLVTAEFISLEEADAEAQGKKKGQPGEEIRDVEEVEMEESLDAAAFIEETEGEDADVPEILGSDIEDEEET